MTRGRANPRIQPTASRARSRRFYQSCAARAAADAQLVGRAQAADVCESQRMIQPRACCGPTANARESGIRPPSRGRHPVPGQVIAGNAFEPHHRERIRPPSWWERNRRQRARAPSRGTHPTVIAAISVQEEGIRTPYQVAPSHAITSGRSARPCGVVPPNQRIQPTPFRRRDRSDVPCYHAVTVIPIDWGGAADAPGVGRARAAAVRRSQRTIQPGACCGPTANAREYRIRPPSQGTHPVPGQASAGNALEPHPRARIRPPSWWEPDRRHRPRTVSRAAHATVVAANRAEWNARERRRGERPRTPTWLVGQRVPPTWCRPTSACSRTPFRQRDRVDCAWYTC
jgi:hypothetical protein